MSLTRRERFEAVAAEIADPVLRYARRRTDPYTAEDVLSETLLVVWRRIDDVPVGGELAWCYAVARNQLANASRAANRRDKLIARVVRLAPPSDTEVSADLPDPQLHRALAQLRPQEQELLRLSAWEDLAPSEIAVILNINANAVSIRLYRARRRLAAALTVERRKERPDAGQEPDMGAGTDERHV